MVQGFICAYVIGNLCIWEGTINAEMYIEVLEQHNIDRQEWGSIPLAEVQLQQKR